MHAYLYIFEALWALELYPVPCSPELFEFRVPIGHPVAFLSQALWLLSFPSAQLLQEWIPDQPYAKELVYFPFAVAFQWFGYGCLWGWWRYRRIVKRSNPNQADEKE